MMNRETKLMEENRRLRKALREAEELIDAIRTGRIDAIVVSKPGSNDSVYTLESADRSYRILIETMEEGALILSREETILYCNRSFAEMVRVPINRVIGNDVTAFVAGPDREHFRELHRRVFAGERIKVEINLQSARQVAIPALISWRTLTMDGLQAACMVVTDLTEQKKTSASLAEKEVLIKEIHHRVKNNMQVISSLVALQADELQDDAMRGVLGEVSHRVRSMAMVHEKLYQSTDLARVDFADYARSLLFYLRRAHGASASGVRLVCDLQPVSFTVNAAVPCGLILNELFTNALKHAFPDKTDGEVRVSLGQVNQRVHLSVRDNGVGLALGFDWRQARSLGLRLVRMLAGQLNAEVDVTTENGTEFTIKIDKPGT